MRRLCYLIAIGLVVASCGGGDGDSNDDGTTGPTRADSAGNGTVDPCTLAGDEVLAAYFGDLVPEGEAGETGPLDNCRWRDANSNSLLIQTATDHDLFRPDPCRGCVDLSFGDDGYATESLIQSNATFVEGSAWYSVTTTGFGDDIETISTLAETIYQNAGN
jgi:hypothetical protein